MRRRTGDGRGVPTASLDADAGGGAVRPEAVALLVSIVDRALCLTRAQGSVLEVVDGDELVYFAAAGTAAARLGTRVSAARSLSGACLATARPTRCDDGELDPRVDHAAARRVGARSMLCVPVRLGGAVAAVLKVYSDAVAAFDERDADALELLASLVAAAEDSAAERAAAAVEANSRFRGMLETASNAFVSTDDHGRVRVWNGEAERLFGWSADEAEGRVVTDLIVPPGQRAAYREAMGRLGVEPRRLDGPREIVLQHRTGRAFPAELSLSVVRVGHRVEFNAFLRDVTERQAREARLRAAEERFHTAFAQAPTPISLATPDGRWLDVNEAFARLLGAGREDLIGARGQEWTHPDDRAGDDRYVGDVVAGRRPPTREKRFVRRDGCVVWVSMTSSFVAGQHGRPEHVITHAEDVTDRRRARLELREAEERFRTAFDAAPVGMTMTSLDGRFLRVNDAFAALVGRSREDLIGRHFSEVTAGDERAAEERLAQALRAGERGRVAREKRYVRPDGTMVSALASAAVVQDPEGRPLYWLSHAQDITEQVRATAEMRRLSALLQSILDNSPAVIFAKDVEGRYLFVNDEYERLFGLGSDVLVGRTDASVWEPEVVAELHRHDAAVIAGGMPVAAEEEVPTDGETRIYLTTRFPLRDEAGGVVGICGVAVDITERKQRELDRERRLAEEREQVERLRELDRLKDEFVEFVSHELRTPLTSIEGYLECVLDDAAGLDARHLQFLTVVRRNAERLNRLVTGLLDLCRTDAGRLRLQREPLDLALLAREAVEAIGPTAEGKGISVEADIAPAALLDGDRLRLAQTLDNLLSNAVKYTPTGGRVHLRLALDGDGLRLAVSDTGIGIPHDERAHVFERFFRASTATSRVIAGTGLGLAITKTIVDAHCGEIRIEDREGPGTTFLVTLPAAA